MIVSASDYRVDIRHFPSELFRESGIESAASRYGWTEGSDFRFGLEFEFYLRDEGPEEAVRELLESSLSVFAEKIAYLPYGIEENKECDTWYVERDLSLDESEYGFELVSPLFSDARSIPYYVEMACGAIARSGYATDQCGVHLHVSSPNGGAFDLIKALLLSERRGTFEAWRDRSLYAKDLCRVLANSDIGDFLRHYPTITKFYNLNLIEGNHTEVRCYGGDGYLSEPSKIVRGMKEFIALYADAIEPERAAEEYAEALSEHGRRLAANGGPKEAVTTEEISVVAAKIAENEGYDLEVAAEIAVSLLEEERIVPRVRKTKRRAGKTMA